MESSIPLLRQCIESKGIGGFYILRREIVDSAEPERFSEMMMLRLHRRDVPAKWVGRYHNQIVPPAPGSANFWVALRSEIRLEHWRFKSDPMLRARRSAKILAEELEEEPQNLYIMIELANSLSHLGDPRAVELRLRAAKMLNPADARPATSAVVYTLDHLITHPAECTEAGFTFEQVREMCRRWFPRSAPLKWVIACLPFLPQEGNFPEAAVELAEVVRLFETDELDKLVPFDPRVSEDANFNLGVCFTRLAMLDDAEKIFQKLSRKSSPGVGGDNWLRTIAELRKLDGG